MPSVSVLGSGPNGLAAAITLARAGLAATVYERNPRLGGACATGELTLPGFRHDLGSSVYPLGAASPLFRSLPIRIPWIQPAAACAHPLDDGTAVVLENSVEATAANLDAADRAAYRRLVEPTARHFEALADDLLGPIQRVPRHPLLLARFGLPALLPAVALAKLAFRGARARALFAGMAAHSVLPLEAPTSAAVGLVLMAAAHAFGWPIAQGGAQSLTNALAQHLESLGGMVVTGQEINQIDAPAHLAGKQITLACMTPRQLLSLAGSCLPESYRRQLRAFRSGAGTYKIDYALAQPIPWRAANCLRAATVHLGGTLEEIAAAEAHPDRGECSAKPFVLLVQPSLFDPTRAPSGKHTAWAYCHVPNGSALSQLEAIEDQIERFAPGFRDCVLARAIAPPAELESWNRNLLGGDLTGGAMSPRQLLFRPTPSLYRTPLRGLYLSGASTPPGGGVHGMAGYHAAQAVLHDLKLGNHR